MFDRFVSFGVTQLFGGARRGQPLLTGLGAAISIWALFRRLSRKDKPVYTHTLGDGETLRITQFRGAVQNKDEEA
ncbi:MAG: hypothetical protein QNJ75_03330 [Acidimicrobiia bacterium]|nr:hypothetical protein [Acidimicrobiia bacterium]